MIFKSSPDLELAVGHLSIRVVAAASILVAILILLTIMLKTRSNWLFFAIVTTVGLASVFLISSTVYLNQVSSSKGPVHWHADTEVWVCGQQLDYQNPQGRFSNKIGTPTLHEHSDKRIHLEGVVVNRSDASLGKFFRVIGGEITDGSLVVPTNDGKKSFINGQKCNGQPAEVQVFAYRAGKGHKTYTQQKLVNPGSYIISPDSNVPPGDCLIIEFDTPKDRTDKICRSWAVAESLNKIREQQP